MHRKEWEPSLKSESRAGKGDEVGVPGFWGLHTEVLYDAPTLTVEPFQAGCIIDKHSTAAWLQPHLSRKCGAQSSAAKQLLLT